ncbi:MAG TPA: sigma-70 family RNA polymerase sigma factor [Gemmatimonadaceae bacterium]|nr:sigma-70 family RNA polymerase sigma factor [Gemmatimonadaceae bacterium]
MSAKPGETAARLLERARHPTASLHDQHAAFTRLVEQSQHVVFGLAMTYLRDVEDAKDAAQDAFATAWRLLRQLRDPSAFEPWLKSIVATECSRRRRGRALVPEELAPPPSVEADASRMDYESVVASALERLPDGERRVTVLFYFLGYTQPQIARLLQLKPGTVGKRLHSARLRIRRGLPRSVRGDFVRLVPSEEFGERVRRGLLDEYVGEYRFERRADHVVSISRIGDSLISDSHGQRHLLVSGGAHSLLASHYDGEARFRRDRRGRVTHFVYYEFGKRLGVARRLIR